MSICRDSVYFEQNQLESLLNDQTAYLWGAYDGSGEPIELIRNQNFAEFLLDESLLHPDEILVDEEKQRGNTINYEG